MNFCHSYSYSWSDFCFVLNCFIGWVMPLGPRPSSVVTMKTFVYLYSQQAYSWIASSTLEPNTLGSGCLIGPIEFNREKLRPIISHVLSALYKCFLWMLNAKHSIQHKVHGFSILTKTTFSLHMHKILLSHRMNQRKKYIAFIDEMFQDTYSFLFECPQSFPSISHTEEGRTSRSSHLSISWSFIHACSTQGENH